MWKQDGDLALAEVGSHAIHGAVTAGSGLIETLELGHRYGHLSPWSTSPEISSRAPKGAEEWALRQSARARGKRRQKDGLVVRTTFNHVQR